MINKPSRSLMALAVATSAIMFSEDLLAQQLEEIVVTARKRSEARVEVPVAITTYGKGFLEANAIKTIEDASLFTPGMVGGKGTGQIGGDLFMRGIGSGDQNALLEQSIALNINGAQVGGEFMFASMIDVEQLEVLRGPQALFFGKNSPGGVISLQSARPTPTFEAHVKGGYETTAREKYGQFVVSGPLTDTLAGRLMVNYSTMDGWLKVQTAAVDSPPFSSTGFEHSRLPGRDELVARGTLEYSPTDRLNVTGWLTYVDADENAGMNSNMQMVHCPTGVRQAFLPEYAAIDSCKADNKIVTGNFSDNLLEQQPLFHNKRTGFISQEMVLANVNVDYDLTDTLSLTSVTAFSDSDIDSAHNFSMQPTPFLASGGGLEVQRFTQEFRLLSDFDSPVNFMVGGFYEDAEKEAYLTTNLEASDFYAVEVTAEDSTAYSGFAQLIWDINEEVQLSAGSRYSEEKKKARFRSTMAPGIDGSARNRDDNLSSEVNLRYMPTNNLMFYIAYKEGFKAGGIDASFRAPTNYLLSGGEMPITFDEETVSGFEGGIKAELLDSSLRLDLTVFSYEMKDMQLSFLDTETLSVVIENAGKSTTEGVEFEYMWLPLQAPGLTFQGSLAYLDASYDDFIADCYNGQSIAQGCNLNFDAAQGRYLKQDLKGERLTRSPRFSGTVGVGYEWPVRDDGYVRLSTTAEYSGKYQSMLQNGPNGMQSSYVRAHASLEYHTGQSGWKFALIGRNLTDKWVLSRTSTDVLAGGVSGTEEGGLVDIWGVVQRGRQVNFEVTKEF